MRIYTVILIVVAFFCTTTVVGAKERISTHDYRVLERAYKYIGNEDYKKCLETLEPLLTKSKPPSYAFSYGSICYGSMDKGSQALLLLKRGVKLYPEKSSLLQDLGYYQMQGEDYKGAVATYKSLITKTGVEALPNYYYHLAFAQYRLESYKNALATISSLTTQSDTKNHYLQLQVYCQVALQRWKGAEKTTRRIIARAPQQVQNWHLLSQIAVNQAHYSRSASALEIVNILKDEGVNKALIRQYEVQAAWNESARLQPQENAYDRAKQYFISNQYSKAMAVLLTSDIDSMEHGLLQGQIAFALGEDKDAVRYLRLALRQEPSFVEKSSQQMKKFSDKDKRRYKDSLKSQIFILTGQIYWLNRDWLQARDTFKELELVSSYSELGKNLANCMQFYLDEEELVPDQPGLYDPPLVVVEQGV